MQVTTGSAVVQIVSFQVHQHLCDIWGEKEKEIKNKERDGEKKYNL